MLNSLIGGFQSLTLGVSESGTASKTVRARRASGG
jgi:hypothetical protein